MLAPSLCKDLMIFYAPKEIYTGKVTVIELICASVCITSMICFSIETKYRNERALDSEAYMARHRMGARGNATSFPLPWNELLHQLNNQDDNDEVSSPPDLPRVGTELADVVSILLKTNEEDNPKAMASFIHQAYVRRHVVVKLIVDAKQRGHRAYAHVDIANVHAKAEALPEGGVPLELVTLLPHDGDLDKIQIQKAATPVSGRADVASVAQTICDTKPNAVVLDSWRMDST